MKWYALCHIGAEYALERELQQHNISCKILVGGVSFEASNEQVAALIFSIQTATRILASVYHGNPDEITVDAAHNLIPEESTFRVSVECVAGSPSHISSQDFAAEIGEMIPRKVNLASPDLTVFCQVSTTAICGIDIAGDLSKRYYRVFSTPRSVKGSFAASILYAFPYEGDILDPFANSGEIAIEAAMRSTSTSPLKYSQHIKLALIQESKQWSDNSNDPQTTVWCTDPELRNIKSCKKNAKLAGVEKHIKFSKIDPEWMDVKFEENQISSIITIPPPITKRDQSTQHIQELCYQASYILKKGGILRVCCMTEDTMKALVKFAKDYKLQLQEECIIYAGKLPCQVLQYGL